MEQYISDVLPFLSRKEVKNISLLSKEIHNIIGQENISILEGLYRIYPANTTYTSILNAIRMENIRMIQSLIHNYVGYLPVRWIHILRRMLWKEFQVNKKTSYIASIIFDRVIVEEKIMDSYILVSLRSFIFKYNLLDKVDVLKQIDNSDYPYDDYKGTVEYTRFSPNVKEIVDDALKSFHNDPYSPDLAIVINYSLMGEGRVDIIDQIYKGINDKNTFFYILDMEVNDSLEGMRLGNDVEKWIKTHDLSTFQKYVQNIDVSNLSRFNTDILSDEAGPQNVFPYLTNRKNIETIIGEYSFSGADPEVYDAMLDVVSDKDDYLFWKILNKAVENDIPEILEKYIFSVNDTIKLALEAYKPPESDSNVDMFFQLKWYEYRKDILSDINM